MCFAYFRIWMHNWSCSGVLEYFIHIAQHSHPVTPRVLEVEARVAVSIKKQVQGLVEPSIGLQTIQKVSHWLRKVVQIAIIETDHEDRGVDGLKYICVAYLEEMLPHLWQKKQQQ